MAANGQTILRRLSITRGTIVDSISRDAMRRLMRHNFPGNVRELENILEHAYVLSSGRDIEVEDLPDWLQIEDGGGESGFPLSAFRLTSFVLVRGPSRTRM